MTGLSKRRTALVMIGLALGMLLAALDQTVVTTAMPKVVASLGGFDLYAWVFTSYMLTSTVTIPLYGKLSDLYGRKIFFLFGMAVFLVASVLSGRSATMEQLIFFRGLQGIGAGAIFPVALAVIADLFPPGKRGKVQGMMGTVFGVSSVIGPSLGGYITDNLNWRWVFYVNIPVGIIGIIFVLVTMPWDKRPAASRKVDYPGAALLVGGLVPLLLAFSWAGSEYAWLSSRVLGLFAVSAVLLAAFVFVERRTEQPILPPSLFSSSIYRVSVVVVFLTAAGMFGTLMFIPLFVQGVIGMSATDSGYVLTPMMLSLIVGSIGGGQLVSRWGRYRYIAMGGLALMSLGMFLFWQMDAGTTNAEAVRNMIITGIGLGVTMPLYVIVVQNAFEHAQMGVVTSSIQFFRSIGGTVGVAVMGSYMNMVFKDRVEQNLSPQLEAALPSQTVAGLDNPQVLLNPEARETLAAGLPEQARPLLEPLLETLRLALSDAVTEAFLVGLVVVVVAWGLNWRLREIPLRMTHAAPAGVRPPEVADANAALPGQGAPLAVAAQAQARPAVDERPVKSEV
jgi:EmrB/QacA subfamily drug resistance transporter